ncbi:MAG: hypothetical protein IJB58_01365 [Bacteroidales bacterium]|nr:hypothetical protein [Bacteroidales bacterium]
MDKIKILLFSLMALFCTFGVVSCQEEELEPAELLIGKWCRTMGYELVVFPDGTTSETEINDTADTYQLVFYANGNGETLQMANGEWGTVSTFRWASDGTTLLALDNDSGVEKEASIVLLTQLSLIVEEQYETEGNRVFKKASFRRME